MSDANDLEEFGRRVADPRIELVSFDVFDTLICRPTRRPDHLYQVIGFAAAALTGLDESSFALLRRRAENEARVVMRVRGEEEVGLDQIYERFCAIADIRPEARAALVDIEEATEAANFQLSEFGLSLLKKARAAKKKIVFLSDTYYSEAFMRRALGDLVQPRDRLIISSAEKRTKHSGALFEVLLAKHPACAILHVGDNVGSDIRNPLKLGIGVFYVSSGNDVARRNKYMLTEEGSDICLSLAQGLLNAKLPARLGKLRFQRRLYSIGYGALGPFWLGFCQFIRATAESEEVERIYFLARDGFILQKAYERLTGQECDYLSVSRHTLYLAYAHLNFEAAFPLLVQNYSEATIGAVIARLLPSGTRLEKLKIPGWAKEVLDEQVDSESKLYDLKRIVRILTPEIKKYAASHFEEISAYFEEAGILGCRKIAIVDLGWHGSMQVLMQELLRAMQARVKIVGLYAGLFQHAKKPVGSDTMNGYLFEYGSRPENEKKVRCGPSLLEVLHSAPHGTTIGYARQEEGNVVPVYGPMEAEGDQYERFVVAYQKGGLDFLSDFVAIKASVAPNAKIEPDVAYAANLLRLVSRPSEDEAPLLSILGLHPDFGPSKGIIYLVEDRGAGGRSMWPIGRSIQYRARLPKWFNEEHYLDSRPDVLEAVQAGDFKCGYEHYLRHGKNERTS